MKVTIEREREREGKIRTILGIHISKCLLIIQLHNPLQLNVVFVPEVVAHIGDLSVL